MKTMLKESDIDLNDISSPDFTYDAAKDAFIPPKKHPSWVLDETTLRYVPPVAYPETFDMHAVFNPTSLRPTAALKPAPPAPRTTTSYS